MRLACGERRFAAVLIVALTGDSAVWAADIDAFLAGTNRNCSECDLSGRDFTQRDFKRARLERANLKAPSDDLTTQQ